MKGGEITQYWK